MKPNHTRGAGGPRRRTLLRMVALAIAAALLIALWRGYIEMPYAGPQVRGGVLDLSGYDLSKSGPAYLEGELAFYPGELLSLSQLADSQSVHVGGYGWNNALVDGEPYGPQGFGTYHITIIPPAGEDYLMLDTPYLGGAYIAYAGEEEIGRAGVVSADLGFVEISLAPVRHIIAAENQPIELILHVANTDVQRGGMFQPPAICLPAQAVLATQINYAIKAGLSTLLMSIGALAVILYLRAREEIGLFYFGGACFASTMIALFETRHLITLPGYWSNRAACLGMGLMALFLFVMFARICKDSVRSLPHPVLRGLFGILSTRIGGGILLLCAAFSTAFLPLMQRAPMNLAVILIWGVATAFTIARVYVCAYYAGGQLDAYMASATCYSCAAVMDMLGTKKYTLFFFNPSYFGGIAMMLILFAIVTRQFMNTSRRITRWNEELEARVRTRTAELDNANRLLRETEKTQRETFESIAHDLRAPVSAAMGAMELLGDIHIEKEHRPILLIAQNRISQLSEMVSELFQLTKIESGYLPLEPALYDLAELNDQIAEYYVNELQFTHSHIHLVYDHSDHPAASILVDYDKLITITDNLISNAIRYGREDGVLRMGYSLQKGEVVYYVQDSGPGIPEDKLGRVFDRFFRVDNSSDGAGLGLSIVKSLVDLHKGRIWAENRPEGGCRVSFALPLLKSDGE